MLRDGEILYRTIWPVKRRTYTQIPQLAQGQPDVVRAGSGDVPAHAPVADAQRCGSCNLRHAQLIQQGCDLRASVVTDVRQWGFARAHAAHSRPLWPREKDSAEAHRSPSTIATAAAAATTMTASAA